MKRINVSGSVSLGLVLVCCLSLVQTIQAGIVTVPNGDFSSPTLATDQWRDNFTPDDWTYSGDEWSLGMHRVGDTSQQFAYINGTLASQGTLTQADIGTSVHAIGDVYTLTFNSGNRNFGIPTLTADILVNGSSVASKSITVSYSGSSLNLYSLEWTADTTGTLGIKFHFDGPPAGEYTNSQMVLDDVGFSYVSIPEPNTVVLVVTGAIGLLAGAWRKRRG